MDRYVWALVLAGIAADIAFVCATYAGKKRQSVVLKGLASLCFVMLGVVLYLAHPTTFGALVVTGLALGALGVAVAAGKDNLGDVILELRFVWQDRRAVVASAVGTVSFLLGHLAYITALLTRDGSSALLALALCAVLSIASVPALMKRVQVDSRALKTLGALYLVIAVGTFSVALGCLLTAGVTRLTALFACGSLIFASSDFMLAYYGFVKKVRPLRAIYLLAYYAAQLLIACTICWA